MSEKYQDRIDAYLRGEMSQAQKRAFEHDLATDQALRREYELTRLISSSLARRQQKLQMMAEWESQISGQDSGSGSKPPVPTIKKRMWWTVASTAAAACLVVGFFVTRPNSGPSYSSGYADAAPVPGNALAYKDAAPAPEPCYEYDMEADACPADDDYMYSDTPEELADLALCNPADDVAEGVALAKAQDQYESAWRQINRLIERGKTDDALRLLVEYKDKPGVHHDDAIKLFKKLTDKRSN